MTEKTKAKSFEKLQQYKTAEKGHATCLITVNMKTEIIYFLAEHYLSDLHINCLTEGTKLQ